MAARFSLCLVLLTCLSSSTSFKILVYNPKFGHSHSAFLGTIADVLTEAGHNVTSIIPIMDGSLADGTVKSRAIHVKADTQVASYYSNPRIINFFEMHLFNPIVPFFVGPMFANLFGRTCQQVIDEEGFIDQLRNEYYDVYITENFDVCGIGLAKVINPRAVIGATSTCLWGWQFSEFGIEQSISYRPTLIVSSFNANSIISRFWNAVGEAIGHITFAYLRSEINGILKRRYGAEYPSTWEQSANVAFVLTNSEPLIESAAPSSARVIDIPGIGAKTPKPLDEYWLEIINRRAKTVLLSFGTIVKSTQLSNASKRGILQALAKFPEITFIWKYEEPEDEFSKNEASNVKNIVLTKWMPQVDLLAHANIAAFITHGSMASLQEAALRGVPGIFIPIFGDQPRNAGMMQFNGLGLVFDKFDLHDGPKLAEAIREVLENKEYAENAVRLSRMLARKPYNSRDLLVKHVEFAAEFGASSALRPQSVDMNIVEHYNIDIALIFGLLIIFLCIIVHKLILALFNFVVLHKRKLD